MDGHASCRAASRLLAVAVAGCGDARGSVGAAARATRRSSGDSCDSARQQRERRPPPRRARSGSAKRSSRSGRVRRGPRGAQAGWRAGSCAATTSASTASRRTFGRYRGRVVLVVNTATECGYTPQFEGLEALYRARRRRRPRRARLPRERLRRPGAALGRGDRDVLQGELRRELPDVRQDAGSSARARTRCYRALTAAAGAPEWNFNKYLLDRRGRVVARYGAGTEPERRELTRPRRQAARCPRLTCRCSVRYRTYVRAMEGRIPPRIQGDCGEFSAIGWLLTRGAKVYLPFEHSPDVDLVADLGGRLIAVQVKTSTVVRQRTVRSVMLQTRGGNRSWSGVVEELLPDAMRLPVRPCRRRAALVDSC